MGYVDKSSNAYKQWVEHREQWKKEMEEATDLVTEEEYEAAVSVIDRYNYQKSGPLFCPFPTKPVTPEDFLRPRDDSPFYMALEAKAGDGKGKSR